MGEAIETATVVIVNDVQNDPRWFSGSDQTTGFVTRALMVVPLRRGERTIGALEVINKRDGSPFNDEDQALLAAFAGQAAVAIENARLFAQTDQALTDRVGELSMMQRIDRELNAALDVQRVMNITLDWAMKNTRAYAGSVGIVAEDGIRIIATSGYGDTVEGAARPAAADRPRPDGPGGAHRPAQPRARRAGRPRLPRHPAGHALAAHHPDPARAVGHRPDQPGEPRVGRLQRRPAGVYDPPARPRLGGHRQCPAVCRK